MKGFQVVLAISILPLLALFLLIAGPILLLGKGLRVFSNESQSPQDDWAYHHMN